MASVLWLGEGVGVRLLGCAAALDELIGRSGRGRAE